MKKSLLYFLSLFILVASLLEQDFATSDKDSLRALFIAPPDAAKLRVYW